jgi:hypothetical protein
MGAMMNPTEKPAAAPQNGVASQNGVTGRGLRRLQFELALDLSLPGGRPVQETLASAAETAGVDLLFVLPAANGHAMTGVVRVSEEGTDSFLQVKPADGGFVVADEAEMDKAVLGLARTSLDVLQRMSADSAIREPLAAAG